MKANHVEHFEFFGGPEDGLIVKSKTLPWLKGIEDADGAGDIPMFIRLDKDMRTGEDDEVVFMLIGRYVCDDPTRERLKYHWVG